VENTLGTQIGEGGTSQKDVGGKNTARQGKVMELLSEKNPKPLKLPDGSTIQPKTGSIPTSMKIIKYGGKIFTLVDIGSSIHRIWNASDEELIQVIGEEAGGFAFGAIGAEAGAGICVAIGVPTGGLGLIACGIVGAIGGSKVGKYVGGAIFGLPMAILQGMYIVSWLLEGFMDVTEAGGRAIHGFFQFIFEEQVKAHERLNFENWDVRFLPDPLKNDINLLGQNMWSLLNREEVGAPKPTQPMDKVYSVLKKSQLKLIELGIPLPLLQSMAQKMTEINVKNGGSPYSADQFVNMNSVEFVEFLEMWKLQFKQSPVFIANPENYWSAGDPNTHMGHLNIHYRNVIETRSKLNIHNWGSFAIKEPLFEFFEREQAKDEAKKAKNTEPEPVPADEEMLPGETPVDMVAFGYDYYDTIGRSLEDHIREIGSLVWSVMGPLNFKDFTSLMYKPLSAFNPDQAKVKQIAHGLSLVINAIGNKQGSGILQMTDVDADFILTQTPADLVDSLVQYNLLTYNKAPSEIAEVALIWMNVGFEPW